MQSSGPVRATAFRSKHRVRAREPALSEIIERLLRFDPLPYDPAPDT
jgi:hypothetical protein